MAKKQDKTKIVQIWGDILDEGFTSVPNILLKHRDKLSIKAQHLTLIIDIMSFKWDSENPFPSYSTLAKRSGVAERSIKRLTQDLEEMDLLKRTPRFDEETGAQITTIYDFRPLVHKLTKEVEFLVKRGDKNNTGGVTDLSREGVTDLSPKEYTKINNTKLNKNPGGKTSEKEKERVQKHFRKGVFRDRIFEVFDNLYGEIPIDNLVFEGSFKACKDIMVNREQELEEIPLNPQVIANQVRKKFPYKKTPKETNNARKFFVEKICDTTCDEILNYL